MRVLTSVAIQRLAAQLLTGPPAATPEQVTRRLLAVQAQDPRGMRLAIRARTAGLSAADVDHCLTAERSLVVSWLNRGTLHLVCADDYWWLHALTAPPLFTANARRLAQEGVPPADADRGVAVIEKALAGEGPLTRAQLAERISAAGVRTQGQALAHLILLAALRTIAVRGPMVAGEQAYVLVSDWLGAPPAAFDRDRALAELARRYLAGHGPATAGDLSRWAGLALRDARRGLDAIAGTLACRADGLAGLAGRPAVAEPPPPRLLGAYEPLLLGWSSREPFAGGSGARIVSGGVFRPFALADGRAVGTWNLAGGKVKLTPFTELTAGVLAALAADAADVERFLAGR